MAPEWFYTKDGKNKVGPFSVGQLQAFARSGQLQPSDMVWKQGMPRWAPLSTIPGLLPASGSASAPPLAVPAAPVAQIIPDARPHPLPARSAAVPTGMKTPSLADEVPVKDGAANLQRGIETVGGWLYLTNRRLIFESHAFNIQTGATVIPLATITDIQKCWTKLLNLIPLFPNSFAVATKEGKEYRFVTFARQAWIEALEDQRT